MKAITLKEIANSCSGQLFGDENVLVTSIVTDSRQVTNGTLFAAIKGERVDGHNFVAQCIEAGAVCALVEEKPAIDCDYILVESTLVALKGIAEYYRSLFTIPFISVTGSVGKTSTKEMLYAVLSQKFNVHKVGCGNADQEFHFFRPFLGSGLTSSAALHDVRKVYSSGETSTTSPALCLILTSFSRRTFIIRSLPPQA